MDVVRQALAAVKGDVRVSSQAGSGTRVTLKLPMTLTIVQAMVVRVGDQRFALPIDVVRSVHRVPLAALVDSAGQRFARLQGQLVPLTDLHELLRLPADRDQAVQPDAVVLLLASGDRQAAVLVDEGFSQREIVVKRLGALLGQHPAFSGATLTGQGEVMLILDAQALLGNAVEASSWAPTARSSSGSGSADSASEEAAAVAVRALVVDDSLSVRRVAAQHLAALGCEVLLAVDGLAALETLRAKRVDIVFTDLEMPRMHGYELLAEMQRSEALRGVPAVVVTSRAGEKHQQRAMQLGAVGYLTKPFTRDALREQLESHVAAFEPATGR